ncbi:hypothetical protein PITC_093930 [Penicillium italicum]|uniref:Uncharacterized protein n=1 Tax=Penicillium italicum TaxID=40296 RepID=A0A0A2KCA2_PENIT|nr:hypothetical protein PITC_093930 [Penicillium italicum]
MSPDVFRFWVTNLLWNHENLDMGLHDKIHQLFGGIHTKLYEAGGLKWNSGSLRGNLF